MDYLSLLTGGSIGSVVTFVGKGFFDEIFKKREAKRIIQRTYFENKLKAYEKAASVWYSIATHLNTLSSAFSLISDSNKDFNYEIFQNLLNKMSKNLDELAEVQRAGANSILAYYDIDDDNLWGDKDTTELFTRFSEANFLNDEFMELQKDFENAVEPEKTIKWAKIMAIIDKHRASSKAIAESFKKAERAQLGYLNKLRKSISEEVK